MKCAWCGEEVMQADGYFGLYDAAVNGNLFEVHMQLDPTPNPLKCHAEWSRAVAMRGPRKNDKLPNQEPVEVKTPVVPAPSLEITLRLMDLVEKLALGKGAP